MTEIDVTLICTVYNEEDTIRELLDSIQAQSRMPDEIVIVDGGSDDGTYEVLQEYSEEIDGMRVLQQECNIAEGRNIAVEAASNDHIIGTDGGCVLDEDWCREMVAAFEDGAEYVIGMFEPLYDTLFEKVQGRIVCSSHTVEELRKGNRGPSSRSVGFTRRAWQDAGGYPEDLYTGEDSKFNAQVMAAGYEPGIAEDAYVYWRMRPSWSALWDQFRTYAEGDAKGGNLFTHPSSKLGVTKNSLVLAVGLVTLLSLVAVIGLASAGSGYAVLPLLVAAVSTGLFSAYYGATLRQVVAEDGWRGLAYGIAITQLKSWAWFSGFVGTVLRHPSLVVWQVREARRLG